MDERRRLGNRCHRRRETHDARRLALRRQSGFYLIHKRARKTVHDKLLRSNIRRHPILPIFTTRRIFSVFPPCRCPRTAIAFAIRPMVTPFFKAFNMTKRIEIAFRSNGEGTLTCAGMGSYPCLGQPGRMYPIDLTVTTADKFEEHYSEEFQVLMKWCILIWGQKGIYIHEGPDNLHDNDGPSAGCIHLGVGNARRVFDWLDERTRITISYPWTLGDRDVELWHLLNRVEAIEHRLRLAGLAPGYATRSVDEIVTAAKEYADNHKVFANGCSEMVRSAYAAGGISISGTANDIMNNYPAVTDPRPGDIAGWTDSPNGHVVIYLSSTKFVNCPGPGQATKYNSNMGHSLSYRRPT
jgi:hypothetical protein